MKRCRRFVWVGAAVLLAAACGMAFLLTRPSAFRVAYERIELGMNEQEVEELVPDVPKQIQGGIPFALDWEGRIKGERRHVHLAAGQYPTQDPLLAKSRLFGIPEEADAEPAGASGGVWQCSLDGPDRLAVYFDANGKAVEKAYLQYRSPWWDRVVEIATAFWPF